VNKKIIIPALCLITDVLMSVWSYFKVSNYDEFIKYIQISVDSPDFQLQLYKIFLQTLIIVLALFIILHIVIYVFYFKEKKMAQKYVRLYSAMAALSAVSLIFTSHIWLMIIPTLIYAYIFWEVTQKLKSTH
jgi:uncharacterized protein YxeA